MRTWSVKSADGLVLHPRGSVQEVVEKLEVAQLSQQMDSDCIYEEV